jgi:hypothetical protein
MVENGQQEKIKQISKRFVVDTTTELTLNTFKVWNAAVSDSAVIDGRMCRNCLLRKQPS